jgi:hypothetical protein
VRRSFDVLRHDRDCGEQIIVEEDFLHRLMPWRSFSSPVT